VSVCVYAYVYTYDTYIHTYLLNVVALMTFNRYISLEFSL